MTAHRLTEPRKGFVYVVRFCTPNGTEMSRWYRNGSAARRFADVLAERCTPCRIYRTDVQRWQEDWPPLTSRTVRRRKS